MTYQRMVGFGEAMLRLTAPAGTTMESASGFTATVGGAELNGLIAAAREGMEATWVTALPEVSLARLITRHAHANQVDPVVAPIEGEPGRVGLYFVEMAAPPRPLRVLYDRAGSAFSRIDPEGIEWEKLLDGQTCLYLTGITPALGDGPRRALAEALRVATEVGARVALDVNYRAGLWSRDEAYEWLAGVLPHVDLLSASIGDLRRVGIEGDRSLAAAVDRFDLEAVVSSRKRLDGDSLDIEVTVADRGGEHRAEARARVVDPVGTGDALFGTFLALFPTAEVGAATERALGAAVTCCGLFGDALVGDPWDGHRGRGVIR